MPAAAALLLGLCTASCASGDGVVEGLIFESQREIAIEGAVVSISSLEGDGEEQYTLTDINGLYRFDGVPEGLNEVLVVKEGYSGSGTRKLADVVEDEVLTLDFRLGLLSRRVLRDLPLQVVDAQGPLAGATVTFYQGPCLGRLGGCFRELAEGTVIEYRYVETLTTNAEGRVTLPIASAGIAIEEFTEYLYQVRITAPEHQNAVFEFSLTIDNVPSALQFFLPRL